MTLVMGKHALVFVHGMGGGDPREDYERLWSGIASAWVERAGTDRADFDARFAKVEIAWGSVTAGAKDALHDLAFEKAFAGLGRLVMLRPLRAFMTKFLGDVVAYVTDEDNLIRSSFFASLDAGIRDAERYSIVAHSLGSAIAHDFLFDLMCKDRLFRPLEQPAPEHVERLQTRFFGLFTMGSPVGLFMLRKSVAFSTPTPFAELRLPLRAGQRWLNFWDAQDVIAYPLEDVFRSDPGTDDRFVLDVKVDTGDLIVDSHTNYWRNKDVARSIAAALPG
jgi:hypothetical protein